MENVNRKEQNRALEAVIDLPWGAGTKEIIAGGGVQVHLSIFGQKFQKVENDENRFFAITSSKLFKN